MRKKALVRLALGLLLLAVVAGLVAWRRWPLGHLRQAEAAMAARDYAVARDSLGRYLASRPDDPRALLLAARAARNLGEYYEASEYSRRCRENGGDREAIAAEEALIAVQRGEAPSPELRKRGREGDELALVILEALIQYDLDTYRLYDALHGLTRYLESRPDDLHALLARGYVWERFLNFADALKDYRKAVDAHPRSERARLKLAQTLLIAATPGEALEQYQWLAERHPERREVVIGLARCRRLLGQPEDARKSLDAHLEKTSADGEALWERGQIELDLGNAAAAEPWLRRGVAASPHDRRIAYSLGRCLLAQGRREEVAKIEERVAELDADLRRLDKVRQAVMQRPNDADLRCQGGLLFLRNGERQEGIKWLRLALRLDPNCQAAREALAEAEARPRPR